MLWSNEWNPLAPALTAHTRNYLRIHRKTIKKLIYPCSTIDVRKSSGKTNENRGTSFFSFFCPRSSSKKLIKVMVEIRNTSLQRKYLREKTKMNLFRVERFRNFLGEKSEIVLVGNLFPRRSSHFLHFPLCFHFPSTLWLQWNFWILWLPLRREKNIPSFQELKSKNMFTEEERFRFHPDWVSVLGNEK